MTGLALVLALTAPVLGGGPDLTTPPLEAPVIVELRPVAPPRTPPPTPVSPVQVPTEAAFSVEIAASSVQPKPPPAVVHVAPTRHAAGFMPGNPGAIARAKNAPNGQLPSDALCPIWDGTLFRCDMAAALESAANAGMPRVAMTDGYRSYADQVAVKASRGSWAAQPGTSNHGHGTAADIPEPARSWLFRHGADHGLINPAWAKNPNRTERWHWELAS